jgi:hypothetical protein
MLLLSLLLISIGCSSADICNPEFVSYYDKEFVSENVDISIFNSRLELPDKFIEIGVIKRASICSIDVVTKIASEHGAHALIKDGDNFTLIRFLNNEEEKHDEKDYI